MGQVIPGVVLPGATGIPLAALAVPGLEQILYAAAILESMPQPVTDAVREPYGARAVVYCLLLATDGPTRDKQLGVLHDHAEPQSYEETVRLAPLVRQLAADARIPLADMAIPALKELAPGQYDRFCEIVDALVRADNKIELFEYALQKMLLSTLDVHFGRRKPTRTQFYALGQLGGPLSVVLGTLAHAGNKDPELAGTAYRNAMQFLDRPEPIPSRSECSLRAFDEALAQLAATSLKLKQRILDACQLCIVADEKVTTRERELVRVVAAVLECAVPLSPPKG